MPAAPATLAKASACSLLILPRGSGLRAVRFMRESGWTSRNWFIVFAAAAAPMVPSEVHPSSAHCTSLPLPAAEAGLVSIDQLQWVCLSREALGARRTCNKACCCGADDQQAELCFGQLLVYLQEAGELL